MRPSRPFLWVALFSCLWTLSLAGVKELRLPVPTSETIAAVAREMGAATFQESLDEQDQEQAASEGRRVQRKLITGGEDIEDNTEYQEYQGVMGRPGVDFPVLPSIPTTGFSCRAVKKPGYYADLDTDCQVFHICDGGRKISFLCPNGTIFRQSHLICDWWFRVDCGKSVELYEESAEQLAADQRVYKERAEALSRAINKGESAEQRGETLTTQTEIQPSSPKPDTHIDAPFFENAKLNYANRQSARKQQALKRKEQIRPEALEVESVHFEAPNVNQLQYKNSEDIRSNTPDDEEKEQQLLSETASFASSRGNKFGRQFYQENYFTPSSKTPEGSTIGQSSQSDYQPSENKYQLSSKSPLPETSISFKASSTASEYTSSFPTSTSSSLPSEVLYRANPDRSPKSNGEPSVAPQRNFRPSVRLLPTSSQNSNLRQNPSRNNLFRGNKQTSTTKNVEVSKQTSPDVSINAPSTTSKIEFSSPQNINSFSPSSIPQKNFIRPSPDLIPPEKNPTSRQSGRLQAQAYINQNSKTYNQLNRNRTPQTTPKGLVVESSAKRFSSPTTLPPVQETTTSPRQRQKQRRFTSTTQKPVFTAKFRPSKSFSYVELERTKYSQEASTQPTFSSSTLPSFSPIIDRDNKVENVHFGLNDNPSEQLSSISTSYSTSNTPDPIVNTKGSAVTFSTYSSTPSYSPTIPEELPLSKLVNNLESKQTTYVSNNNKDANIDKLASFSNIDPAEINLLPSNSKQGTRSKLRVPDSSGPNALHTLALYYATSESDSGTTPAYDAEDTFPPESTEDLYKLPSTGTGGSDTEVRDILKTSPKQVPKISDEILLRSHSGSPDNETEIDDVKTTVDTKDAVKDISSVLTKATKDSYATLFNDTEKRQSHGDNEPCTGDDIYDLDAAKEDLTEKDKDIKEDVGNDLDIQQSRGIVQPSSSTKKPITPFSSNIDDLPDELKLRDSTDLRELAQVFSRALSAYLEDPDSFRRILSEVRPTEPTSAHTSETTQALEENEDEVLDFSDASNSGPRLITNNQIPALNQRSRINSLDINEINGLVRENNVTEPPSDLRASREGEENPDVQVFTTANPTSLAVDINYLLSNTNNNSITTVTEDSYLPTADIVEDKSRWGRYGGFHNNSAVTDYQPYGSEVSNTVTGKPISETTYVTEGIPVETTLDGAESVYFINKNVSTATSNKIDIESIPEQLGVVPAQDINSLVEDQKDCTDASHNHGDSQSLFSTEEHKPFLIQTEEEIYGRGTDQEKVLIASGSQSFVSRDNYLRILGAKQDFDTKNSVPSKSLTSNDNSIRTVETTTTQRTTTMKSRGSVRFGPPSTADRSDISSFRRRPNKEITFQNVNLGNGVTLERTKTVRYSTPEIQNIQRASTYSPDININPVSINEGLGLAPEEVVATTEVPLQSSGSTRSIIRATTYHPSSSYKPDLPDVIPPRGPLRNSWQWNIRPSSSEDITTPESLINTILNNENLVSSPQDFSTFASTLLPPNVTLETAKEEMLEKKAEEIFGKLNETSANMLMNVMNQAESNTTVRRLVLLLVADRNSRENKSFEESRNQLIQALLKTTAPEPTTAGITESTRYEEKKGTSKKSGRTRNRFRSSSTPSTTTSAQTSTTARSRSPKAYRGSDPDVQTSTSNDASKKPEPQFLRSPNLFPQNPAVPSFGSDPDARAVELLKSLYHLAARWG